MFGLWCLFCAFHSFCTCLHLVALDLETVKITPDRVRILVGETLVLNCTGETTYNGRLTFSWDFPQIKVSHLLSLLQINK